METKKRFTLIDYPEKGKKTGSYSGKSPSVVANKIFNKLAKKLNFIDNLGGTKYLVFYIQDIDSRKIYPYIGTIVVLENRQVYTVPLFPLYIFLLVHRICL